MLDHKRRSSRLNPSARSPSPSPPPPPTKRSRPNRGRGTARTTTNANAGRGADVRMEDAEVDEAPVTVKKSGAMKSTTGKRKLVETETEPEVVSKAATGNLDHDSVAVSSELSELEEMVDATPRPKKKSRGEDKIASAMNTTVSHTRHNTNTTTHAKNDKRSGKDSGAKATRPSNDDIAAFMQIPLDSVAPHSSASDDVVLRRAFLVESSSSKSSTTSGSSKAPSVASTKTSTSGSSIQSPDSATVATGSSSEASHGHVARTSRTRAVPPSPVARPPKPSQAKSFQLDTTKMIKNKKKAQPRTREEGVRVTSQHLIKIKESDLQINVQEPTPQKPRSKVHKPRVPSGKASKSDERNARDSGEDSDVEFTTNAPQALRVPQSSRNRSRSRSPTPARFRLEDLPEYKRVEKRWKKYFVPALLRYQGAQPEPWKWLDSESVPVLQKIWDAIYGDEVPHKVVANECVHFLATQKLWDWRSSLRQAAEVVVGHYLDASPLMQDVGKRGSFCQKIIENARFLYKNPLAEKTTCLFRSQLMLTVLAVHLEAMNGAIDVSGLYPKGTSADVPVGAIGLSAAALERIFKLYGGRFMRFDSEKNMWKAIPQYNPSTGKTSTAYSEFSEARFQDPTNEYAERACKMPLSRITAVVKAAQRHMGKRPTHGEHIPVSEVEVRGRNELADDDDEDDDNDNDNDD
ncbi:hypothetical protein GSI_09698 [Ganoderma sinense ZZ0214-1]|uniref:Uncharacterized protein n=1 Tax=Ganoderma sinense ZZ0214-1 TaxID=1077348 RepID=A0A2G8S330_9APHY|nr:hypothetical protein GSI_09698 [Ganoderma sinense ZZ0214-1]